MSTPREVWGTGPASEGVRFSLVEHGGKLLLCYDLDDLEGNGVQLTRQQLTELHDVVSNHLDAEAEELARE